MRIPAACFIVAQKCIRKKDVRPYLTGITISPKGYIFASNGHMAFVSAKIKEIECKEMFCIVPSKVIPKTADEIEIYKSDSEGSYIRTYKNGQVADMIPCTIVEHKEIDFGRFVKLHKPSTDGQITVNAAYMSMLSAFDGENIHLCVGEDGTPTLALSDIGTMIIMPCTRTPKNIPTHL